MYDKVYERLLRSIVPFHNKVLRFNYDLPLDQLKEVLKVIMQKIEQHYDVQVIYKAEDRLEYDTRAVRKYKEIKLPEFYTIVDDEQRLYSFGNEFAWVKVGIFNAEVDWYLRLFIEDDSNLGSLEPRTGNVEVYACDEIMKDISKEVADRTVGHVLIEGAKKYLEEIYI